MTNLDIVGELFVQLEGISDAQMALISDLNVDGVSKSDRLISFDHLTLKLERMALWLKQNRRSVQ
jgi:hypothetical protein